MGGDLNLGRLADAFIQPTYSKCICQKKNNISVGTVRMFIEPSVLGSKCKDVQHGNKRN